MQQCTWAYIAMAITCYYIAIYRLNSSLHPLRSAIFPQISFYGLVYVRYLWGFGSGVEAVVRLVAVDLLLGINHLRMAMARICLYEEGALYIVQSILQAP